MFLCMCTFAAFAVVLFVLFVVFVSGGVLFTSRRVMLVFTLHPGCRKCR